MKALRFLRVVLLTGLLAAAVLAAANENEGQAKKSEQAGQERKAEEVPDVQTIVEKANVVAYYQGRDGKAKVKMTISNEQGQQREREFIIVRKDVEDLGDQKYYVYFENPPDVRRMVYLVHKHAALEKDDDRWLYLPGLDLVKRIAAGDKRTSFVGSHFLYEDVSGRSLELDTHELSEVTEEFFVVRNTPKKEELVEFGYYDVYIDRETYVPMKMVYYDESGKQYRTIEALKVEKIQDFPTPVKSVVTDSKIGGKTVMEYSDVQYNIDVGEIFEERYLRRPPREIRRWAR